MARPAPSRRGGGEGGIPLLGGLTRIAVPPAEALPYRSCSLWLADPRPRGPPSRSPAALPAGHAPEAKPEACSEAGDEGLEGAAAPWPPGRFREGGHLGYARGRVAPRRYCEARPEAGRRRRASERGGLRHRDESAGSARTPLFRVLSDSARAFQSRVSPGSAGLPPGRHWQGPPTRSVHLRRAPQVDPRPARAPFPPRRPPAAAAPRLADQWALGALCRLPPGPRCAAGFF